MMKKRFRQPPIKLFLSLLFFSACLILLFLSSLRIFDEKGEIDFFVASFVIFPFLLTITTFFYLLSIWTYRIELSSEKIRYRRLFQRIEIPLSKIWVIEKRRDQRGDIIYLKISYEGGSFYIDRDSVKDFQSLLEGLEIGSVNARFVDKD
jgi:hypothetical protein